MNNDLQHTSVSPAQMRAYAEERDIPIETSEAEARVLASSEIAALNATTLSATSPQLPVAEQPAGQAVEVVACEIGDYLAIDAKPMATVLYDDMKIAECYTNEDAVFVADALRGYSLSSVVQTSGEPDENAPWLTTAHMICTDAGIPQGHINNRLEALRDHIGSVNKMVATVPQVVQAPIGSMIGRGDDVPDFEGKYAKHAAPHTVAADVLCKKLMDILRLARNAVTELQCSRMTLENIDAAIALLTAASNAGEAKEKL